MNSLNEWEVGASTSILHYNGGVTKEGFNNYKKSGIEYAELSLELDDLERLGFYERPEKIKQLAADSGVKFWSFHIPFGENINPTILDRQKNKYAMDIMKKCISQAAKIGIETIVIHPSFEPNDAESRRDKMDCSIENMSILSKFCKNLGAVLTAEDLPRTCLGNCSEEIIEFLNSVDDLMFCFDTNHVTAQKNEDFLDELIKHHFQGRVRTIHVSDYDGIDERHRLPFDGTNNWEEIVSKLKKLEYNGVFMYEVGKAWDREKPYTLEAVKQNYLKMKSKIFKTI